jgi:hypothetical protein
VQIAAGCGDVGVAKRGLHLGKRRASIKRMRAMGVAQPVRRDGICDARPLRCPLEHVTDSALNQPSTPIVRSKDRVVTQQNSVSLKGSVPF